MSELLIRIRIGFVIRKESDFIAAWTERDGVIVVGPEVSCCGSGLSIAVIQTCVRRLSENDVRDL